MAGGRERLLRRRAQTLLDERRHGRLAQRPGTDAGGGGIAGDLRQQRGVGAGLGLAQARQQQDRLALQPPRQVGEEQQRRPVAPVQVVDGQQQRPLLGEPEHEPEQPVQRRERGSRPVLGADVRLAEDRRRRRRRAQRAAPALRSGAASSASNSCRTTPKANSPSSSPPRADSTRIELSARRRASASSRLLPMPAGPSTTTRRPSPPAARSICASSSSSSRRRSSSSLTRPCYARERAARQAARGRRAPGLKSWGARLGVALDVRGAARAEAGPPANDAGGTHAQAHLMESPSRRRCASR